MASGNPGGRLVPLDELLATTRPPAGTDWDTALAALRADPAAAAQVDALTTELARRHRFTDPIVVDPDGRVCDGQHRVAATVLARAAGTPGAAAVEVAADYRDSDPEHVQATLWLAGDTGGTPADVLIPWVSSFPIADSWARLGRVLGRGTRLTGRWACPHHLADELTGELTARARQAGLTVVRAAAGACTAAGCGYPARRDWHRREHLGPR